jgi:hypothetical protein
MRIRGGPGRATRGRNGARLLCYVGLALTCVLGVGLTTVPPMAAAQVATAAASITTPSVVVAMTVVGKERSTSATYRFEMTCQAADGTAHGALGFNGTFTLARGGERTFTSADFSGLSKQSTCRVRVLENDGAVAQFSSTVTQRADGSRPLPRPGLIAAGGFGSAWTQADGQTITVINTFTGDLSITRVVDGAEPGTSSLGEVQVTCDGGSYERSLLLDNGQQTVLTDLPSGATCQVREVGAGSGSSRSTDNSGAPNDGVVTILPTRSECWDLRAVAADCRAAITVVGQPSGTQRDAEPADTTTTTQPDDDQQQQPPTTAAPAIAAAPAAAVEGEIAFTG